MKAPTKIFVREQILSLINGSGDRAEIEQWACSIISMQTPPDMPENVWQAINALSGCEERDGGPAEPYIFNKADFKAWLKELDR